MIARTFLFASIIFCFISRIPATATQGGVPDELAAFVERTAADIDASPLNIPQFKSATVDGIEDLGKVDGTDRYLCWLKTDPNRVGYIAVASDGKSFQVLAFSATTLPPQYFLKNLQVPQAQQESLDFAHANQVSAVANVPLVAATKTSLGTESFEISELAASVSAVLNYWQSEKKILLFRHAGIGHWGLELSGPDSEYTRRFKENPTSMQEPEDPNWQSLQKEFDEAITSAGLRGRQTAEGIARNRLRRRDILKPMVRRRLLDPVNARERLDAITQEQGALDASLTGLASLCMKDAMLLQADYLDSDRRNLGRNIEMFFKTRGRTVQLESPPFERMTLDAFPGLLMGPGDPAAVVLGYVDIGPERFASVLFPKTAQPIVTSLAQRTREMRIARGLPPESDQVDGGQFEKDVAEMRAAEEQKRKAFEARGIPYQPPEKDPAQVLREGVERIRALREASPVAEDRFSVSSVNVEHGVHLIRCSALRSWQVLYIAGVGVADNWGRNE